MRILKANVCSLYGVSLLHVAGDAFVHTGYVQRLGRGFGEGMYIQNALEGRFCVHTWYVRRLERAFGGGMYIQNALEGRFRVHTRYVRRLERAFE